MPWRPKVFKSKEDRKKRGEPSVKSSRSGIGAGSLRRGEGTPRLTGGHTPFDPHPGTRVWTDEEIEVQNHPGRRLSSPRISEEAKESSQPKHRDPFMFDAGHPDIGVQTSDDEEGKPPRRSSRSESPPTRSRTKRSDSRSRSRCNQGAEANRPLVRPSNGAIAFKDPFAKDGQGESSRR